MLLDKELSRAVSSLLQRSEKQQDISKLVKSYVEVGILNQLNNQNNQIVYGRRGTGKTHIIKMLQTELNHNVKNIVVYIDARTLGSTAQFTDSTLPLGHRCISLFRDILGVIHNGLLDKIINFPNDKAEEAFNCLERLSNVTTETIKKYTPNKLITSNKNEENRTKNFTLSTNPVNQFGLNYSSESGKTKGNDSTEEFSIKSEDKVIFPELYTYLEELLIIVDNNLYVLFDEWASLPYDVQPYLAEFIKRSFLPNPKFIIKITSLEYRSNFSIRDNNNNFMEFEIGSDISTSIDIDDYYVFDRNPQNITDLFSQILFKHITTELPDNYLLDKFNIKDEKEFILSLFTKDSIKELVRASEGVVRDLINIFTKAYYNSFYRKANKIDQKSIIESARQWFEKDKSENLDRQLSEILRRISEEVIGNKKARSFLVSRELGQNKNIQKLFDLRVIHLIHKGYADKDNPGMRYNIYTLDYGTYVDLKNTSKMPQFDFEKIDSIGEDFIVPFDDKRSIRRIVLKEEILN